MRTPLAHKISAKADKMIEAAILDQVTIGQLNPPAVVDQLRMLPIAIPSAEIVDEIEADFLRLRQERESATATLARLLLEEEYKDDEAEFSEIIASFEAKADEIGAKLRSLEKRVRSAQVSGISRDRRLDDRLLSVARQDFEDRIDLAMFWRAMQAKIWPTPASESFQTGADIGGALRAAIG